MGTRSTIAVKHGERIKAIYCHWDGYVDGVGTTLLKNYDSTKANFLVALGDVSSLGSQIGQAHPFSKFDIKEDNPNFATLMALHEQAEREDWTTFYGRDRGEDRTEFKSFGSEDEWLNHYDGAGVEYYYVMDNGVWYVSAYRKEFEPLHEAVAKLDKEEA